MANSIFKVHEMINKVGFEFDDATAKKVTQLAEKASQLAADNMTAELGKVVSEIGNIFNQTLSKLGKQQIDLSDMIKMPDNGTISKLTNSFISQITNNLSNAIATGINDGISKAKDNSKEIESLIKKKTKLESKKSVLSKQYDKIKEYPETSEKSYGSFKRVNLSDNVEEQASKIITDFYDLSDQLYTLKRRTKEYYEMLVKVFEKSNEAISFGKTLHTENISLKNDESKEFFKDSIYSVSDITENRQYLVDLEEYINQLHTYIIKKLPKEIQEIDIKIKELNRDSILNTDASTEDINAAKKRIAKLTPKKRNTKINEIESAINYTAPETQFSLKSIAEKYRSSKDRGDDWEEQYQWLIKFVKAYDAYSQKKLKNNKDQKYLLELYKPLYDDASPKLSNAIDMLKGLVSTDNNLPKIDDKISAEDTSNKVADAEKVAETARKTAEETKIKAAAEQDAAEAIKKAKEEAEQKRIADEASRKYAEEEKQIKDAETQAVREAVNASKEQKIIAEDTNYTPGSIMDKFSSFFVKEKQENADAVEKEAEAQKTITEEMKKQSKIVLFRRGETEWDANKFRNTDMMGNSIWNGNTFLNGKNTNGAILFGQGGFGDGLWASTISGAKDLATGLVDSESYFEIPVDNYDMLVVETTEFADDFIDFSLKLQKFVLAAGKYRGFDEDLNGVNEESLFSTASNLFERFNMSRQEFSDWIKSMQSLVVDAGLDERGVFTKADDKFLRSHNFGTRFMKTMGYQGVLANTGDIDYDGNYYGSVIYDPDFKSIKDHLQITGNQFQSNDEYLAYLNKEEEGIKNVTAAHIQALKTKEAEKSQAAVIKENVDAIQAETKAQEELNKVKSEIEEVSIKTEQTPSATQDTEISSSNNKVVIDKTAIENLAHIIKSQTQQNDSIEKEPWALESTLQAVKSVLDNIQANISTADAKKEKQPVIVDAEKIENTSSKTQENDSGTKKKEDDATKELIKDYEKLGQLKAEYDKSSGNEYQDVLKNQISTQEKLIATKQKSIDIDQKLFDTKSAEAYRSKIEQIEKTEAKRADRKSLSQEVKQSRDNARLNRAGSALNAGRNALDTLAGVDAKGVKIQDIEVVNDLYNALGKLNTIRNKVNKSGYVIGEEEADALRKATNKVSIYTNKVKELYSNYAKFSGDNSKVIGKFVEGTSFKTQATQVVMAATNGKATIKGFNEAAKEVTYTLKTGKNEFTEYTVGVRDLDKSFVRLQGSTKKTEGIFDSIKRKTKEIFTYFSGSSIIYKVINELRQGIQYVREIDSAMTELKKVTDETEKTYNKFLKTAAKTADKVGSTIKEIVNSTADWARLGYSLEDAAKLAENTSILLNVSEFQSIDEATKALTSTLQAFSYTADESLKVVDVLNEVGNNFAISSDGIATALQDSASSLVAANNSYQQAVALIAAANRVVQDPNSVGAALRTISLRLRGTSTKELSDAGEDTEGAITSKSKLRTKVKALSGVDILTDTGAYKSTYDILLEISKVWKDMSDIDQAEYYLCA